MKTKGYILAALTAITYGMIPLFAIPLKQMDFSFDSVLFFRFMFSALMLGIYLSYKKVSLAISRKEGMILALLGLLYSLSSEFLFLGYDYMPAGVASTILFLYPVLVALIMGLGFHEKISWVVWLSIALAFVGVSVLNGGGTGNILPIGLFIVFLSALSYAVYMIVINKSLISNMQGMKVSFYSMVFSSFCFLCKALLTGTLQPIPSAEAGIYLVLFAFVPTVVSIVSLVYAIKLIGSTPTAIMGSLEPTVAVAVTVIFFHESFTANLAAGLVLIIAAVLLTILSDKIAKAVKVCFTNKTK